MLVYLKYHFVLDILLSTTRNRPFEGPLVKPDIGQRCDRPVATAWSPHQHLRGQPSAGDHPSQVPTTAPMFKPKYTPPEYATYFLYYKIMIQYNTTLLRYFWNFEPFRSQTTPEGCRICHACVYMVR